MRRHFVDNAPATTLSGSVNSSATVMLMVSLTGFPGATPYYATLDRGTASAEVVLVTSVVGATVTVTRNANGGGAFAHTSGATFEHTLVATDLDEANLHVTATSNVHGVSGALVDTSTAQILTNKTVAAIADATNPGVAIATSTATADAFHVNDTGVTVMSVDKHGALVAPSVTTPTATVSGTATMGVASAGNGTRRLVAGVIIPAAGGGGGGYVATTGVIPIVTGRYYQVDVDLSATSGSVGGSNTLVSYQLTLQSSDSTSAPSGGSRSLVVTPPVLAPLNGASLQRFSWLVDLGSGAGGATQTRLGVKLTVVGTSPGFHYTGPVQTGGTGAVLLGMAVYDVGSTTALNAIIT
jgi:hypothetical protein